MWLMDSHCAEGASQFDDEANDRSAVAFGQVEGRENCVEADSNHAITLFYRDAVCRAGRNEYEEFSPHKPSTFQPRCLVLVIEAESRAALRDELIESGRPLTDPLLVSVNYTTARSTDPDLDVASSNCALGRELLTLYEYDAVGQAPRDELVAAQESLSQAQATLLHFERVLDGMSLFQPPQSPPPPPPSPPPLGLNGPPAPPHAPAILTYDEQKLVLEERVRHYTDLVATKTAAIESCVPSAEQTCGRSSSEAPNPWLANDGERCFGYDTVEALEGAYCGYWGSQVCLPHSNLPTLDTLWSVLLGAGQRRRRRLRGGLRAAHRGRRALLLLEYGRRAQVSRYRRAHHPRRRVRARRVDAPRPPLLRLGHLQAAHPRQREHERGALPAGPRRARAALQV
jgi:hypothetical protein